MREEIVWDVVAVVLLAVVCALVGVSCLYVLVTMARGF
jgi:hypothetical protein